jgi:glutaredoxin
VEHPRDSIAAWLLLCALGVLLGAGPCGAQGLYRWSDSQGTVHYSDIPPPAPTAATSLNLKANVVQTSNPGYAAARAAMLYPVVLYTSPDCGEPCAAARTLLAGRGIPFREVNVAGEEALAELHRTSGGNQVPALMVGHDSQQGFQSGAWSAALDAAGYPGGGSAAAGQPAVKPLVAGAPASAGTAAAPAALR